MKKPFRFTPPVLTPVLFLLLVVSSAAQGAETQKKSQSDEQSQNVDEPAVEEIVVKGVRQRPVNERDYVNIQGKRFFDGPYGNQSFIFAIVQELKTRGKMTRVFTRNIKMPQDYPGSTLNRYSYPLVNACGMEKFSFYDGGDFMALAYKEGEKAIIFDVLIGGGPFSSPGLWGPYDQILGKRHHMKLIMGDTKNDGMGLLKSGYAVGMKIDLPNYELQEHGNVYNTAVEKVGRCLAENINIETTEKLVSQSSP